MGNLELLEQIETSQFEGEVIFSVDSIESTVAPRITNFEKRANHPLLILFAGTLLWASDCDAAKLKGSLCTPPQSTESFDSFLNSYTEDIDSPLSNYIKEIIPEINYTKKELMKEILSFKSLELSWDGYGAIPLQVEAAANALEFINLISEQACSRIESIFPNPNGTVSIGWNNNLEESIFVEIGNQSMSYYVEMCDFPARFFNNIDINDTEAKKVSDLVSELG